MYPTTTALTTSLLSTSLNSHNPWSNDTPIDRLRRSWRRFTGAQNEDRLRRQPPEYRFCTPEGRDRAFAKLVGVMQGGEDMRDNGRRSEGEWCVLESEEEGGMEYEEMCRDGDVGWGFEGEGKVEKYSEVEVGDERIEDVRTGSNRSGGDRRKEKKENCSGDESHDDEGLCLSGLSKRAWRHRHDSKDVGSRNS